MINEEHHLALPKLYGAPAYARPPRPVEVGPRPFDEDDLPLEAFRGPDDLPMVAPGAEAVGGNGAGHDDVEDPELEPRPFSLRGLSRIIPGR